MEDNEIIEVSAAEEFAPYARQNPGAFEPVTVPQPTNPVAATDGGTVHHQTGAHDGGPAEPLTVDLKTGAVKGVVAGITFDLPKKSVR